MEMLRLSTVLLAAAMGSRLSREGDPCPDLKAVAPNSDFPCFEVPYRLVDVGVRGLGAFTLRKVKKGEVISRFYPQSHIFLTEDNWQEALANQTLTGRDDFRNDRHILKALQAVQQAAGSSDAQVILSSEDDATVEALHELYRQYLGHTWWYAFRYFNADDPESVAAHKAGEELPVQLVLELGDGRYANHAPTRRGLRKGRGKGSSLLESNNALTANVNKSYDEFASKDIEPCTELLVDYWEETFESHPKWVEGMLATLDFEEFGQEDEKYRWAGKALSNIK